MARQFFSLSLKEPSLTQARKKWLLLTLLNSRRIFWPSLSKSLFHIHWQKLPRMPKAWSNCVHLVPHLMWCWPTIYWQVDRECGQAEVLVSLFPPNLLPWPLTLDSVTSIKIQDVNIWNLDRYTWKHTITIIFQSCQWINPYELMNLMYFGLFPNFWDRREYYKWVEKQENVFGVSLKSKYSAIFHPININIFHSPWCGPSSSNKLHIINIGGHHHQISSIIRQSTPPQTTSIPSNE